MSEQPNAHHSDFVVKTQTSGFYEGFNRFVAIGAKILIGLLILWAGLFPKQAGKILLDVQNWTTGAFGGWYIWVTTFYLLVCLALALWPKTGKIKFGAVGEKPEFSRFSWFSMMFGAGVGVGMLTYSTAEPIFHFANNPDVIKGLSDANNRGNNGYDIDDMA